MSKILILDIETAPNVAYVWRAWKQNIGQAQWVEKGWVMCFAAKWLGEDKVIYHEVRDKKDESKLIKKILKLLDKADFVIAHNANKFDIPRIMGAAVANGLRPPAPFRVIDTLLIARREFGFVSNSLANLTEELGVKKKGAHAKFPGFALWKECLLGNEDAWKEMKEYNILDVDVLEEVYLKLRPYARNHPNVVRDAEKDEVRCTTCGSNNIQFRGYYYTAAGMCYRRFVCKDCGSWGRVRFAEKDQPAGGGGRKAG